jgi:hypothetical protein
MVFSRRPGPIAYPIKLSAFERLSDGGASVTISQDLEVKGRRPRDSRFHGGHRRSLLQIVGRPEAISDPVK